MDEASPLPNPASLGQSLIKEFINDCAYGLHYIQYTWKMGTLHCILPLALRGRLDQEDALFWVHFVMLRLLLLFSFPRQVTVLCVGWGRGSFVGLNSPTGISQSIIGWWGRKRWFAIHRLEKALQCAIFNRGRNYNGTWEFLEENGYTEFTGGTPIFFHQP